MKLQLLQLKLPPDYTSHSLQQAIADRLNITPAQIKNFTIERRSIDARSRFKGDIYYILNILTEITTDIDISECWQVRPATNEPAASVNKTQIRQNQSATRPVVIGTGPAGLFAALTLARAGMQPLIFEQGKTVKERQKDIGLFWGQGILNPRSNILFGEGGAGTFSDGKITSRSKDRRRTGIVRKAFFKAGAAEEVLHDASFHIGSDRLARIIPEIRRIITELGGEFHFNRHLDAIHASKGRLEALTLDRETICTEHCFLATGHSAYEIYHQLDAAGAELQAKPFATGVRVEIPQEAINLSQYGKTEFLDILGAASFALTLKQDCYTFCMCPGGTVIPCSTSSGSVFTNGMSLSTRSGIMGNAAFLLPQKFSTFEEGYDFIQKQEAAAFAQTSGDYVLPATTLADFPYNCRILPETRSCRRAAAADFSKILPEKMCAELQTFIPQMLQKMKGIDLDSAIIYGPETRSSAPVRIIRDKSLECPEIKGLHPIGEGAGYAGGIMSSAIDGIKAAEKFLS